MEENLSKKIWKCEDDYHPSERVIIVEDIKKSIEKVKKRIKTEDWQDDDDVCSIINEEMGDKLI